MKRWFTMAGAICALWMALALPSFAQSRPADVGPGEGDAVLRNPFDPNPAPAKKPNFGGAAPFLETLPKTPDPVTPTPSLKPKEAADINQDIHVTPAQGPWLILIQNYVGPEAPVMARQLVTELRNTYKLNAYTFNFSA